MINRKIMFGIAALMVVGLLMLAGCSSNSQYDNYRQQSAAGGAAGGNNQYVGGGCGVTAPAQGVDTDALLDNVNNQQDGM